MQRVADWQLAQPLDDPRLRATDPRGWVRATFDLGLMALADRSTDRRYADLLQSLARSLDFQLGARPFHADDHLIGELYLWFHRKTGDAASIAPLRARFELILADPPAVDLDFTAEEGRDRLCQRRWCWCDALFMAPPTWAALTQITHDPRFLAYADKEFWATTALLFDTDEQLFVRDSRFLSERDAAGRKIFWSRGNGWVFAGLARLLERLPPNHEHRARYEALFRTLAKRVLALQRPDGAWSASLLHTGDPNPESSGTALFVYGLAWGVRAGLLDRAATLPAVGAGWAALVRAVDADGRLGWVQRIGSAPEQVGRDDTQLYGAGALLLAGGQVADLAAPSR
jgi:rhamnogalacturonyl hydrolase YesR